MPSATRTETPALPALQELTRERVDAMLESARVSANMGDAALRDAVSLARALGWTWEAIGAALGVTRQAACQRFNR